MNDLLVFGPTFEGLFQRALGEKIDPKTKQRLKEAGVDVDQPLKPTYPFEVWMKAIAICAEGVHPEMSATEGRRQLGKALVLGYQQTMIGRAMFRFAKLKGPRKSVETCRTQLRSGNNYTETTLKDVSPNCVELWTNVVGPYPEFTAGILEAGLEVSGATGCKVDIKAHDGMAATYVLSWN